jgi:hypothetical protein
VGWGGGAEGGELARLVMAVRRVRRSFILTVVSLDEYLQVDFMLDGDDMERRVREIPNTLGA